MDTRILTVEGRLGRDAEIREYGQGKQLLTFSVGTTCGYGDKQRTIWYKCTSFRSFDLKLVQYLVKGKEVLVMGEHGQDEWTDANGVAKMVETINVQYIKLCSDGGQASASQQAPAAPQGGYQPPSQQGGYQQPQARQGSYQQPPAQQGPKVWSGSPQQPANGGWGGAPVADDDIPF